MSKCHIVGNLISRLKYAFLFLYQKYVVGIRNNGLGETVLLSTRNKCYIMMGKKVFTCFTLIFSKP